ncbi:MAG: hypothetical protein ACYDC1_00325 [Limisphaerales bacterium]
MPATRLRIFLSSVQKEFATLHHDLKAFLLGDAFLRRFVAEVVLVGKRANNAPNAPRLKPAKPVTAGLQSLSALYSHPRPSASICG